MSLSRYSDAEFLGALSESTTTLFNHLDVFKATLKKLKEVVIAIPETVDAEFLSDEFKAVFKLLVPSRQLKDLVLVNMYPTWQASGKNTLYDLILSIMRSLSPERMDPESIIKIEQTVGDFVYKLTTICHDYAEHGDNIKLDLKTVIRLMRQH